MTKYQSEHTGPEEKPKLAVMFSLSWWWNSRKKKKAKRLEELKQRLSDRKRNRGWQQDSENR